MLQTRTSLIRKRFAVQGAHNVYYVKRMLPCDSAPGDPATTPTSAQRSDFWAPFARQWNRYGYPHSLTFLYTAPFFYPFVIF